MFEKSGIKEKIIEEIITSAKKFGIEKVVLFGSRARGDFRERSDIDLATSGGNYTDFVLAMEETDTLLSFDVVNLDEPVTNELLESIKREGKVLYEKI